MTINDTNVNPYHYNPKPLTSQPQVEKKLEMTGEHIVEVCLSFQNILKLDNLHGLHNLVKLQARARAAAQHLQHPQPPTPNKLHPPTRNKRHPPTLNHSSPATQLDNNIISCIESISHLTCLEWLDLSFNNISKIEGLDTLTRIMGKQHTYTGTHHG